VIARGSYNGAVWIQDLASGATIAGPFVALPETSTIWRFVKPSPDAVSSVAVGEFGGVGLVAAAFNLSAWVARLDDGTTEPLTIRANTVVAVALGEISGTAVVVTGSRSGFVGIWNAETGRQITGVTLDSGVRQIWVAHGKNTIAARTETQTLVLADLLP
jgi:hypothetical protein